MTFAFGVMTFRRCTHVYRLLAPGNISTKSQNKIQNMKYIYTQTHRTTACSYLTPQAKMNFTKFTAFLDLEKVLIWVCVMELQTFITYCTHKLPFAVKIKIPITLRLRRPASMQGKGAAQLFISCTRSRWCTWSSSESSKQISAHVYPCLENNSLVFFLFYASPTTHRFLCRLFPPSAFLTTPSKSIRRLFLFPGRFSCPVCFHTTDSLSPAGAQQSVCPPAGPSYLSPQPITKPKTHQWERSACVRAYTPMC